MDLRYQKKIEEFLNYKVGILGTGRIYVSHKYIYTWKSSNPMENIVEKLVH